jgi:hypothetical protein
MFPCTTLRHAPLVWQNTKGVHPKASKSTLKVNRPDRSKYFNYNNDGGKNAFCCAATGHKMLTWLGDADMYTFLMNTWNTLPESYQQRVYQITLATVKRQIEQAENQTSAKVISTEVAHVDNVILLDYLTSEVALGDPEIRSTDPDIPIDNNYTDDELNLRMPGGSKDYGDEGDEIDMNNAILNTSSRRRATTELQRFDLGTSDVDGYKGNHGNNAAADSDEEEEALQADDGLTQTLEN